MDKHNDREILARFKRPMSGIEPELRDPAGSPLQPLSQDPVLRMGSALKDGPSPVTATIAVVAVAVLAITVLVWRPNGGPGGSGAVASPVAADSKESVAITLCAGPGMKLAANYGTSGSTLVASVASSGSQTRSWIEAAGQSFSDDARWAAIGSATAVAFCYYDGDYTGFPQPPGANLDYTRMLVLVSEGGPAELFAVGGKSMSLAGPAEPAP